MTTPVLPTPDPNNPAGGPPQFAMAVRGYDRGQVDDYVARLGDFLADAEQRAQRAEGGIADLISRNERLTEELRQAIDRRSPQRTSASYDGLGERVSEIIRLAGEEADAIREQARSELAELTARRDAVVCELRRVQQMLSAVGDAETAEEATQVIRLPTAATS